jgi:transposase
MMGRSQKPYAPEFVQEAVRLVIEGGMSRTQVAQDLGVSVDTVARWVLRAQYTATSPSPSVAPSSTPGSERAELARLRRENDQLRMERDILKKALGIFSQMPQ